MKKIILYLIVCLILESCMSQQILTRNETNNIEMAISSAIADFAKKCNLFKRDSVFYVSVKDTFRRLAFQLNETNAKWICDSVYTNILVVQISGGINKIPYLSNAIIGSKGKLPSKYTIVKGKLFYWDDDNYPLTEETLAIFIKYNVLTDIIDVNNIVIPEFTIDDSKKGADYYFCRNALSKYKKKVITNKGLGYYKPPKLKCNK